MITQEELKTIEKTAEDFLKMMTMDGFEVNVKEGLQDERENTKGSLVDAVDVQITLTDPKFLIGEDGKTLLDIQRLIRMMINKKLSRALHIRLDINQYKVKKIDYVKSTASELANQVAISGVSRALPPMSSYDRRIVHAHLSSRVDVVTESQGEGEDRHLVISPKK